MVQLKLEEKKCVAFISSGFRSWCQPSAHECSAAAVLPQYLWDSSAPIARRVLQASLATQALASPVLPVLLHHPDAASDPAARRLRCSPLQRLQCSASSAVSWRLHYVHLYCCCRLILQHNAIVGCASWCCNNGAGSCSACVCGYSTDEECDTGYELQETAFCRLSCRSLHFGAIRPA